MLAGHEVAAYLKVYVCVRMCVTESERVSMNDCKFVYMHVNVLSPSGLLL